MQKGSCTSLKLSQLSPLHLSASSNGSYLICKPKSDIQDVHDLGSFLSTAHKNHILQIFLMKLQMKRTKVVAWSQLACVLCLAWMAKRRTG